MGWAITATCTCLAWAIWVRRLTLQPLTERAKFTERSITVSLILQLCGILLMTPQSDATIGRLLHTLTGQWSLDDWAAHILFLSSTALIGVHVISRLDVTDGFLRACFRNAFGLPLPVVVAVSLALLVRSDAAERHCPDLFTCPNDTWLGAYWTLVGGYASLLLCGVIWALALVGAEPRHSAAATVYIAACTIGVLVCSLHVASVWLDIDTNTHYYWIGICAFSAVFSYATGNAWRQKSRPLVRL